MDFEKKAVINGVICYNGINNINARSACIEGSAGFGLLILDVLTKCTMHILINLLIRIQ